VVKAPMFGSTVALGSGPVRIVLENGGGLRRGRVQPAPYQGGWLAIKTHFLSTPGYRGPFVARAAAVGPAGRVVLGATPQDRGPLVAPGGATPNEAGGWREFPYFTFVRAPGCYAWQVDGRGFSDVIVASVASAYRPPGG
jgi:hypothetical protein